VVLPKSGRSSAPEILVKTGIDPHRCASRNSPTAKFFEIFQSRNAAEKNAAVETG